MKTPAEKCAERLDAARLLKHPQQGNANDHYATIAAIIQSEYAPKSPDKCAKQAAERIVKDLNVFRKLDTLAARQCAVAAIITETYAPTIQLAREAIQDALNYVDGPHCTTEMKEMIEILMLLFRPNAH